MSELSLTSPEEYQNGKKMSLSSLFLSKFRFFCSFIISHPFYFSYLLFFSPNIFKILSFLSPIFVTTTLLILALLTTLRVPDSESLETQPSFLLTFCSSFLEPKFDVNDEGSNSLEMYKMVVEASSMECASTNEITFVDKFCSHESTMSDAMYNELVGIQPLKFKDPMYIEKEEEEEEEEREKCEKKEEKEENVKPKSDCGEQPTKQESKIQKVEVVGDRNDLRKLSDFLEGVEKKDEVITEKEEEEEVALRSVGSMRKEKEWRRTLACKLFEERHNAYVGMDELWETYETETEKKQNEEESKKKKKSMMKTKSIEKKEVVEEEEEDEDGIDQQQLCCLQALKFSTGKMHLGIARRPNLLKLSKAFKGFGKFYNATKYPKKV